MVALCFCTTGFAAEAVQGAGDVAVGQSVEQDKGEPPFAERVRSIMEEFDRQSTMVPVSDQKAATEEKVESAVPGKTAVAAESVQTDVAPVVRNEPKYDFDWQNTPLNQTLYAVAKISNKKIVINGELAGTVYTSLRQVTFDEALNFLSKTFNFNWMLEGDTILVSTSGLMLQSQRFDVHFANKEMVKTELVSLSIDEKSINVNSEYNSISVTGTPYQLSMAARRIKEMDKPVPQCLIMAQMIEISHGKNLDLGMKYTMPSYSHTASDTGDTDTLHGNWIEKLTFSASSAASRALSKGKVVARPMVLSLNGQEALITMGDKVPVLTTTTTSSSTEVTVTYQDVGNVLKVTPVIDQGSNTVGLNIEAEVSNISKWVTSGSVSAPQISSRKATTTARLKSGESLVIGGLMTSNEIENLSGIPGLMNLPILGEIFKFHSSSKENSEVFITVTPYIVDASMNMRAIMEQEIDVKQEREDGK